MKGLPVGAVVFASGGHAGRQIAKAAEVNLLPPGLTPERAVFARLMEITVDHLGASYPPDRAQEVYARLFDQSLPTPAALFDWS